VTSCTSACIMCGVWSLHCQDRIVPLRPGRYLIGRDEACQVRVNDHFVSRRHAELVVGEERVVLRDLGSRNGVLHHYRRV